MSGLFKRGATRAAKATTETVGKVVNAREIRETYDTTATLARGLFTPAKSGRNETFGHAVLRRGLTEDDLAALHRQWAVMCCLFLAFMTACVAWAGYFLVVQESLPAALASGGAFLAFLGHYIRASFRASQIEARELFSLHHWLRRPSLWMPAWTLPPPPPFSTSTEMVPND